MDGNAYYDIDDILADAELIPVVFSTDAADLGWLDEQSMDDGTLHANTRVELPLWLATSLAIKEFVNLELPRVFQHAFRAMLHADPSVVDLHQKCFYFYEFGTKLATLIADPDLGHTLCRSLNTRFADIVRRTANRKQAESLDFTARLAHLERQLFDSKQVGITQLQKLHDRTGVQLTMAPVLAAVQRYSAAGVSGGVGAGGGGGGSNAARRPQGVPGALRNITNEQSVSRTGLLSNVAVDRRALGAGADDDALLKPTAAARRPNPTQTSTLAHLTALNADNQPLPSHMQKRFGMAATQQRNTQMQVQQQQQQRAAQANSVPQAQSARKRKVVQNL